MWMPFLTTLVRVKNICHSWPNSVCKRRSQRIPQLVSTQNDKVVSSERMQCKELRIHHHHTHRHCKYQETSNRSVLSAQHDRPPYLALNKHSIDRASHQLKAPLLPSLISLLRPNRSPVRAPRLPYAQYHTAHSRLPLFCLHIIDFEQARYQYMRTLATATSPYKSWEELGLLQQQSMNSSTFSGLRSNVLGKLGSPWNTRCR